ncbi:hypothetical protein PsalMR5_02756 [Piscirickettsia salmonis]|nr:hypothetical protein PsalSR1_02755 [Piscirickettsia salmonis]QGP58832.1 hypothetical protein PsalBI1_01414 [Piscirickettsia salmonis]QGP64877.1 hypothetical protein PsalMR5_02756 [Piscirickettsia salmonis]
MMKGLIGILLLIGFLAIVITYWVARLEVPVLVSYELQKVLSLKINSEIFNLSYKKIDAGFTFFLNGSFQLDGVTVKLKRFPEVLLMSPKIAVTGFKLSKVKGIQVDSFVITGHQWLGDGVNRWSLGVRYYQDSQNKKKNLALNVYKQETLIGEFFAVLPAEESLFKALNNWSLGQKTAGLKINYIDHGLRGQLAGFKFHVAELESVLDHVKAS